MTKRTFIKFRTAGWWSFLVGLLSLAVLLGTIGCGGGGTNGPIGGGGGGGGGGGTGGGFPPPGAGAGG